MPFIMDLKDINIRTKMNKAFAQYFVKNKEIINKDKPKEEFVDKNEEFESSFGIPLVIVGNKAD